ncbi:unnamed protein product [Mesocestoides corti]|uniref:Uncharacterized protein n=4 Tax=Mesocestoides corti TaxID=53468 RepID=A0A0R3UM54_MESCO|nr:unnamed protein product [Mesocestoides corti]
MLSNCFFCVAVLSKDFEKISATLEAHKTDYSYVAETLVENMKLREEVMRLTDEAQALRSELDQVKQSHIDQLDAVNSANKDKLTALCREYEEKLTYQSNQFTELMDKEKANFAAQRDAWNEEKANLLLDHANELASAMREKDQQLAAETEPNFRTEILRQISEVQNQAQAQVTQLQWRIDQIMNGSAVAGRNSNRTPRQSREAAIRVQTPLPQPKWDQSDASALQQQAVAPSRVSKKMPSAVSHPTNSPFTRIQPQAPDNVSTSVACASPCQKRLSNETPQLQSRKSLKVAAVPPVLVVSGGHHPLLSGSANSTEEGSRTVELPNSVWGKASDLLEQPAQCKNGVDQPIEKAQDATVDANPFFQLPTANMTKIDFMPANNWFAHTNNEDEFGAEEGESQFSDCTQTIPSYLQQQQQQHQQLLQSGPRKRLLFAVHSGSN